jgi:hypothetical protein
MHALGQPLIVTSPSAVPLRSLEPDGAPGPPPACQVRLDTSATRRNRSTSVKQQTIGAGAGLDYDWSNDRIFVKVPAALTDGRVTLVEDELKPGFHILT